MARKKKQSKLNLTRILVFLVLVIILVIALYFAKPYIIKYLDEHNHPDDGGSSVVSGELEIHFLELGNKYTGDSVYIQVGEVDILIDESFYFIENKESYKYHRYVKTIDAF